MITTAFLYVIYGLVWTLVQAIALLPDVTINSGIGSAVVTASGYVSALNNFLPMTTILAMLTFFVGYETIYFGFKIIYWIIKRIPTQS